MSDWLRTGDRVVVTAGNDKGKTGKILRRMKRRLLIEGVNQKTKHLRPTEDAPKGRIVKVERSIDQSNVMFCPSGEQGVKLRVRDQDGKRELVYRAKGKEVVHRTVK